MVALLILVYLVNGNIAKKRIVYWPVSMHSSSHRVIISDSNVTFVCASVNVSRSIVGAIMHLVVVNVVKLAMHPIHRQLTQRYRIQQWPETMASHWRDNCARKLQSHRMLYSHLKREMIDWVMAVIVSTWFFAPSSCLILYAKKYETNQISYFIHPFLVFIVHNSSHFL